MSQAKTRDLFSSAEEEDEEDYFPESLSQKGPFEKSWLVRMIETEYEPIKKRAVDYLELLSDLTVLDYILDEDVSPKAADNDLFLQSQENTFSEVEKLKHLIPAMILLEDSEKERVALTPVIRQVLDNSIIQPFGITILFCDFIFHLFIAFGWRSISFAILEDTITNANGKFEASDNHLERFLESMFYISTVYFIWRLLGEIFSTSIISWKILRANFYTFWTLVDLVSIILASIVGSLDYINVDDDEIAFSPHWFGLFAVVTGFLWLKLLSFLKVMNPTLATFMLAISQVSGWPLL